MRRARAHRPYVDKVDSRTGEINKFNSQSIDWENGGVVRGDRAVLRKTLQRPIVSVANPELSMTRRAEFDQITMFSGVKDLAERYDAFMLDQFGVLHNGKDAYKGVAECLQHLKDAGKPCVILSNYAGRSQQVQEKFLDVGIDPAHITGIVTSGELAHNYMARNQAKLGTRALWISWAAPDRRGLRDFWKDLDGYSLTSDVNEADFILVSGVEALNAGTDDEVLTSFEKDRDRAPFTKVMRAAIQRKLFMLCTNPDLEGVRLGSWRPGALAKLYEDLGGQVRYFGKPTTSAFEAARLVLEDAGVPWDARICHIGDSLHHDVAGSEKVALDCAFVVGTGVHRKQLPDNPTVADVDALCRKVNVPVPQIVLPRFAW